jgi:hypothetical protein
LADLIRRPCDQGGLGGSRGRGVGGGQGDFRVLVLRSGLCPDRRVLGGVLGPEDLRFDPLNLRLGELGAFRRGGRPAGFCGKRRPKRQSADE